MVLEGEECQSHVGEDEILCQEIEKLKQLFSSMLRLRGQVIIRIMGLCDATKQHCDHTCETPSFSQEEGAPGHQEEQACL